MLGGMNGIPEYMADAVNSAYSVLFPRMEAKTGSNGPTKEQMQEFVNKVAPIAVKVAKTMGFNIVSCGIAQACHESNYGTQCSGDNNLFGVKGKNELSKKVTTHEGSAGTRAQHVIQDEFRGYGSVADSIQDFYKLLATRPWFYAAKDASTPSEFLYSILHTGFWNKDGEEMRYATDRNYANAITEKIAQFNLTEYDKQMPKHASGDDWHFEAVRTNPNWFATGDLDDTDLNFMSLMIAGVASRANGGDANVKQIAAKLASKYANPKYRESTKLVEYAAALAKQGTSNGGRPSDNEPRGTGNAIAYVASEDLNIRSKPTTKSSVETRVPGGSKLMSDGKVIDGDDGRQWTKVSYTGEKYRYAGYCATEYLKKA